MTLIDTLLTTLNRHRARRNNRARVRRMTATFWGARMNRNPILPQATLDRLAALHHLIQAELSHAPHFRFPARIADALEDAALEIEEVVRDHQIALAVAA